MNTTPASVSVIPSVTSPRADDLDASTYVGNLPAADRNAVLKALANRAGIRLPQTRIPEGESLLPIGEENKRALQAEIASLPDLTPGLEALRATIRAEDPRDFEIAIQGVRMEPTKAGLYGKDKGPTNAVGYTRSGFGHALAFVKPASVRGGAIDTLLALSPKVRADAFNEWAERATRAEKVIMRTHRAGAFGGARRIVRAVVSERHSLEHLDDLAIADVLQRSIPAGGKVRLTRGADRSDFEVIWPTMDRQIQVGDIAYVSLRVTNSETKGLSCRVVPQLLRVLCYNFTTAFSEGADEEISIRHVGEAGPKLARAFQRALAVVDPFVKAFGDAYKVGLPGSAPTRGEILARVGKVFELSSTTLDLAGQLWDADGARSAGDTLAGTVNALTRASQSLGMADAAEVERAAGKLILKGWGAVNF